MVTEQKENKMRPELFRPPTTSALRPLVCISQVHVEDESHVSGRKDGKGLTVMRLERASANDSS